MSTADRLRQIQALAESAVNNMARNPEVVSLMLALSLLFFTNQFGEHGCVIQSPQLPTPLFDGGSAVVDFHLGDLQAALEYIQQADTEYWMVMYYAHWDAESLETAREFDLLAKAFSRKEVTFVAVNCWWPRGSCKFRVKPPSYPVFVGHVLGRDGVQYTGIKKFQEMQTFVHRLQVPYTYIQRREDILALRALEDTIAIAYFNFTNTLSPRGLDSFHQAALSSLEKDPIQPTPFAVVTNTALAESLGLNQSKSLVLLRNFNHTVKFPLSERFKAASILSFVYGESREQYTGWMSPTGVKSTILATQIMNGPALVLFTSHKERKGFQNNYYMLREVMLQYSQCHGNETLLGEVISYIQHRRHASHSAGSNCISSESTSSPGTKPCCQSLASIDSFEVIRAKGNVCNICEQSSTSYSYSPDYCSVTAGRPCHSLWPLFGEQVLGIPNSCNNLNNFYNPFSICELCCAKGNYILPRRNSLSEEGIFGHKARRRDHSVSGVLSRECIYCESDSEHIRERNSFPCEKGYSDKQSQSSGVPGEFLGLLCRANHSISFFAVRKEYFSLLAERLGVNKETVQGSQDVAMIIYEENEEYYLHPLDEEVTAQSLATFVLNYTNGELSRNLTSGSSIPRPHAGRRTPSHTSCITEVTSDTFQEIVLDESKDVLLLHYTPWCGACKRIAHLYLSLAQLFESSENIVIARINGDQNDLPWEFVPVSYPTFIMFPSRRKENSILYRSDQPITLTHLVQFVVRHSS